MPWFLKSIFCCCISDEDESETANGPTNTSSLLAHDQMSALRVPVAYTERLSKFLTEHGISSDIASINEFVDDYYNPLMKAVEAGNLDLCKDLSAAGANMSATNSIQNTALHLAVDSAKHAQTSVQMVDIALWLMLEQKVDPNAENKFEATPLSIAKVRINKGTADLQRFVDAAMGLQAGSSPRNTMS